jgi:hypothetical protein
MSNPAAFSEAKSELVHRMRKLARANGDGQ